jgi:exopolysaccharide biosynthesis polyprenyl glycosylphosphotransferase
MSPLNSIRYPTPLKLRPNERRALLLIGDFAMQISAMMVALYFWAKADAYMDFSWEFVRRTPIWFFGLPILFMILLSGLYEPHRAANEGETLKGLAFAAIIGMGFYLLFYFLADPGSLPRRGVLAYVLAALIITSIWRFFYIRVFTAPQFMRRVLLVGGGETGQLFLRMLTKITPKPFIVIGIIDDDPEKIGKSIEGYPVIGDNSQLLDIINKQNVTDLIVAISGRMQGSMFQVLLEAQESGIEITRMPVAYEELFGRVPIRHLEADWILRSFVDQTRGNVYYDIAKRLMDIVGALVGMIIFLVLFPFIAIATLLDSGWPIFYMQTRLGRGGQSYQMIKLRTMIQNAEADGQARWTENHDQRTTRVGAILRKTHLDEVPQFINVLRGEMSLVGPRSERPEFVDWFQTQVPFYRARLLVKPGMTGWAQLNQSYAATVEETILKLEYDLYYVKRRSIFLDLRVILQTPAQVFGFRGR